jgi:uncharacterized protein YecE (DUF72 family)
MLNGKIHIGTSGWHYKHWKGTFYPPDIKDSNQFEAYQRYFDTVELNNSFYMLPAAETFENWRKSSSDNFIFAVKASRFFTHMKKLIVERESIRKFFTNASRLEEKLGPVLFQLPPHWKVNVERLREFIKALPSGYRYTFEFREHSWYTDQVYEVLLQNNCAFCIYELQYHLSPIIDTADFVYVRLHGPGNKYQGSYNNATLRTWAERSIEWKKDRKDVFIYFDNDQLGYAAFNAVTLKGMIN